MNIRINQELAQKKWGPVLENMGVIGRDKVAWMSEYAEYHSINENAYVNAANGGMGSVVSPQPSVYAGSTINAAGPVSGSNYASNLGNIGSGDLGQNLLPVSMKIAAQTIGLDLVAVKPSPGPKLDLLYIDFQYDDVDTTQGNPQVFKITSDNTNDTSAMLTSGAFGTKVNTAISSTDIVLTVGGFQSSSGTRLYFALNSFAGTLTTDGSGSKAGKVEFLGYSRIDGLPIFRAFRQANAVGNLSISAPYAAPYAWDTTQNTFNATQSMTAQITAIPGLTFAGNITINLISALEDQIPSFTTNFSNNSLGGKYPMSRSEDDTTYAGVIGPKVTTKSISVGTIEVSSVLRRTEIEDIKSNTGLDIVQKMESILVNELSQTISKQILIKIFEMGDLNRASAPLAAATYSSAITNQTIFDLDTKYVNTTVGGETTHAVQRKLITKLQHASNYISTEGRVGPAQFAVTNGGLGASFMDIAGYTINPLSSKINSTGQLYPVGQIGNIQIYVDPYMKYNDNRIVLGRKNNPDQPGIIFVPYLLSQSISLISEATFAPRMLLRSRYAIADLGWYPQKQYMTIKVSDTQQLLN